MSKSKLLLGILLASISGVGSISYAISDSKTDSQLAIAKHYVMQDKGHEALATLKPLWRHPSFTVYFLTAKAYAEVDDPLSALHYYKKALSYATNADDRHAAYFGIAKMQFWLDNYLHAEDTYRVLLNEKLDREDHELALAGLVKSLAYEDRPRLAYCCYVPKTEAFTTPEMVVAAAQASLWSGWPDITKSILENNEAIISKIHCNSPLGRDLLDVRWQTDLATTPDVLTPAFYFSTDSEDFIIRHSSLNYTHYWNQQFQTSVTGDYFLYTQDGERLVARGLSLAQTWKPTRELIINGRIEPTNYGDDWHPFLWSAFVNYQPNDYISATVSGLKEVVETFPAFADHISDDQYAISLTLKPFAYVTFNGSVSKLYFSDDNNRPGYFVSMDATVLNSVGLHVILIQRLYSDAFHSPDYFSPDSYMARTALLRLSRKLGATWHYYIDGGFGRQWIRPDIFSSVASSQTHQWGAGVVGPLNNFMVLNASYADVSQASAFINSSGYRQRYGSVAINFLLD